MSDSQSQTQVRSNGTIQLLDVSHSVPYATMEAMLSEFDYFNPAIIQSAIVPEYEDVISSVNAINPSTSTGLNNLEFNIPGAADLYRDLSNSYLMVKIKVTTSTGGDLADNVAIAPVNLAQAT